MYDFFFCSIAEWQHRYSPIISGEATNMIHICCSIIVVYNQKKIPRDYYYLMQACKTFLLSEIFSRYESNAGCGSFCLWKDRIPWKLYMRRSHKTLPVRWRWHWATQSSMDKKKSKNMSRIIKVRLHIINRLLALFRMEVVSKFFLLSGRPNPSLINIYLMGHREYGSKGRATIMSVADWRLSIFS